MASVRGPLHAVLLLLLVWQRLCLGSRHIMPLQSGDASALLDHLVEERGSESAPPSLEVEGGNASAPSSVLEEASCKCLLKVSPLWVLSVEEALARVEKMERCCPDLGSIFGWHGARLCPKTIGDVVASAARGSSKAHGGASGAEVVITPEYVIKVIPIWEAELMRRLVAFLQTIQQPDQLSLLVPICRAVSLSSGQSIVVMPNMMLQGVQEPTRVFDLKGNWAYPKRSADWEKRTWKDMNFHDLFRKGIWAENASFKGEEITGDDGVAFVNTLLRDTGILVQQQLMDYSLFVDMVDLCPSQVVLKRRVGESTPRVFYKTEAKTKWDRDLRPIYRSNGTKTKHEYMYYLTETSSWHIGQSVRSPSSLKSTPSRAGCPNEANWGALSNKHGGLPTAPSGEADVLQVESGDEVPTALRVQQSNANKPLLWASANGGLKFAMTISIIDVFMHESGRGFVNELGAMITLAQCRPFDIDPLPAAEYRTRFMHMIGYKDPNFKNGPNCGSCLGPHSRNNHDYTYLNTWYMVHQRDMDKCEWR